MDNKLIIINGQEINVYQFMQADGNRLLKCPNLSINCLDACCFMQDGLYSRDQASSDTLYYRKGTWLGMAVEGC